MSRSKGLESPGRREARFTNLYGKSVSQREFEQRKRNKLNKRNPSRTKGSSAWLRVRHRVRKQMLSR